MKKILNVISKIVLIISIIVLATLILANLVPMVRIFLFGITVGGEQPNTIWWTEMTLKGFDGIKVFYKVWGDLVWTLELPIAIICIIYQIVYFKVLKKYFKR